MLLSTKFAFVQPLSNLFVPAVRLNFYELFQASKWDFIFFFDKINNFEIKLLIYNLFQPVDKKYQNSLTVKFIKFISFSIIYLLVFIISNV